MERAADLLACIEAVRQELARQAAETLTAAAHARLGPSARMARALVHRSRGGNDDPANLLVLCRFHHQQGEHGLLARCRGEAPLDVLWRLGHADLATGWRNEMRLAPRPARDGRSVATIADALIGGIESLHG